MKTLTMWSDDNDACSIASSFEALFWKLYRVSDVIVFEHRPPFRLVLVVVAPGACRQLSSESSYYACRRHILFTSPGLH